MNITTIIKPQTGAVTTSALLDTSAMESVVLHADGLAGAEEVDVYILGGQTEIPFYNGAVIKLTNTITSVVLPTGPTYGIRKDATVAACGVYASFQSTR